MIPKINQSKIPPSVLPILTPIKLITINAAPDITEWNKYKLGAKNKNKNSVGSEIPVTTATKTAEIKIPLMPGRFFLYAVK